MLKGRCALITGSTQGLGYAMAERLAAEGCNIVLNGFGDAAEIESRRRQLEAGSWRARPASRRRPGRPAPDRRPRRDGAGRPSAAVDILINNAVVRYFAPLEAFRPEDWDRALAVNLSAAFHTTGSSCPACAQRDFGRIVNISSVYGLFATVNRVDYVTTKTALIGFTRAVALETAGQNITCNAICPGTVADPGHRAAAGGRDGQVGLSREEAVEGLSWPRASRRAASSMGGVAALARSCADRRPPTSPARPSRSTAAGAPADGRLFW